MVTLGRNRANYPQSGTFGHGAFLNVFLLRYTNINHCAPWGTKNLCTKNLFSQSQLVCYSVMVKFELSHRFYAIGASMTIDPVNYGPHVFLMVFTPYTSKAKHCMYLENMAY